MHISGFSGRRCARLIMTAAALVLTLAGCGSDDHGDSLLSLAERPAGEPDFSDLAVHQASSRYNSVLVPCATADAVEESCTLQALPLLGQETGGAVPTIDQIMDRVVVSHPWMGERFRQVLGALKPDIRTLLKGVTAIVIDDDIRPSYYYPVTAAIYLDPDTLWLTPEEWATVSRQEDYRSDFVRQLSFVPLWRYTLNNDYASSGLVGAEGRTMNDILYDIASLLYHELAHANDFVPPERIGTLDPAKSVLENVAALDGSFVSDQLKTGLPLSSSLWPGLSSIIYNGAQATAAQRSLTAADVGIDFAADRANDDYAYAHQAEDVSMLFEETMMKFHYGLERDIAFASWPSTLEYVCNDFVVGWGNRNRIAEATVKPRAEFVAEKLLPGTDFGGFLSLLPPPTPLRSGTGWCANLDPSAVSASALSLREPGFSRQLRRDLSPPHVR